MSQNNTELYIPQGTLVVLSGLPGAGKSHLKSRCENLPEEAWISSDKLRGDVVSRLDLMMAQEAATPKAKVRARGAREK